MTDGRLMTEADRQRLSDLRESVDATFDQVIGSPRSVAVLHYPYDGNVGNHMMFMAIADYLSDRKITIAYASHAHNFDVDTLRSAIGSDPILFLGGVTLSRLWPTHASTKRLVATEFPHNRLVSLTSTMMFVDDDDAAEAANMFGDHGDVVLLAREHTSAAQATRVFGGRPEILVEHDSALRIGPMQVDVEPLHDILWLHRDDLEGSGTGYPDGVVVFDWPDVWDPMYRRAYVRMRACGAISRIRNGARKHTPAVVNRSMSRQYRLASHAMVRAGAKFLATGRVLVTDRMHPHVLSALIGQPVVLLPDRFGKNRSIYDHSTAKLSTVHWAETTEEAHALAQELVRSGP